MQLTRAIDGRRIFRLRNGLKIRLADLSVFIGLLISTFLAAGFALSIGTTEMGPFEAYGALMQGPGNSDASFAIWDVRVPRILMGLMAGWCVALAGAMLQSLSQNPLADPGLLGLSQGSMVTVMVILVFLPAFPQTFLPFAALLGGLAVGAVLITILRGGQADGMAILLMGIAVETILSSVTSILILHSPPAVSQSLGDWMAGSLFRSSWDTLARFAPWFALSFPMILVLGHRLRSLDFGDQMAMALGEAIDWTKPAILIAAVLLTSAAVTAVGPLIFLGVMAPHLANFLAGASGRSRLVLSAMVGGLLVIAADTLTRGFAGEVALPAGLSIVVVGVPLFIITLRLRAFSRMRPR